MSTALAVASANIGQLSARFAQQPLPDDLGAGINGGFGRIGYKGKVWSTNYRGEQHLLLNADNTGALPTVELVIVKASAVISKTWYEKGYVEGSIDPPDCLSSNGLVPDAASPKKQAATCALCPKNKFGSQIKQDGTAGKGKACSDTKRLAVVPLQDVKNELLGGPMLLRVPAASLNDVAAYDGNLRKMGYPYYGVGTRIGFDIKEAFPKFVLNPIRALTDAEADIVLGHRGDPTIDRILAEDSAQPALPAAEAPPMQFEQQPVAGAPAAQVAVNPPTAAQVAAVVQQTAAVQQPAPVQQTAAVDANAALLAQIAELQAKVALGAAPATTPKVTRKPRAAAPAPDQTSTPPAAQPSSFGGASPAQVAAAQAGQPDPVTTMPSDTSDFDASIDDQLEALMGK